MPEIKWMDCGFCTLLHPVSKRAITTRVIEQQDFGRIAEVYHYGNEPERDFRLMLHAPALARALKSLKTSALRISDLRHNNLPISDEDWSELYNDLMDAREVLRQTETAKPNQ